MIEPKSTGRRVVVLIFMGVVGLGLATTGSAQEIDPELYRKLQYRFIGPDGNRAIAVVGEPGDPDVIYVGAASGGIFKTTDGGVNWDPVFDEQQVSSIGALAVAPSDPNVVWAGTGETFIIRPALSVGDGIYRSTDRGKTWKRLGLEKTGRIGRILIDPRHPDIVLACALGHAYAPQKERGVYRTSDGGKTWEQVLFVDEKTGCSDIAFDPNNPRIVFASMWQIEIDTWALVSGGSGSGVYVSRDNGMSWERISGTDKKSGLPGGVDHPVGKIGLAVAPSDSQRVYALIEDTSPGFYRSDDGGETWRRVSQNHTLAERAPYYTRFAVDPLNASRIYFASVRFSLSLDGGASIVDDPPEGGGDTHDIWIDPTNPHRIMVADDGGITVSLNRGRTFKRHVLPIAQMYHVATDERIPYNVFGNRQDGYSYRGPSNSRSDEDIPLGLWHTVGGCESGWAIPDPADDNIVWSGCYDGGLERFDLRTGQVRNVRVWPEASYGWEPAELKYRWHWSFPIAISPHDHRRVYVGSQFVHQTTDGGHSWKVISPDLTTNDKSHQQSSGGLTVDNLFTFDGAVLFAIAESPLEEGMIWTGSNDGQVQITRDGGESWTNVTENIPGLPPWGTISNIEPSRFEAGTAYLTVDLHQQGDFDPYVYKTTDYGRSWRLISSAVPKSVLSFVHVVREDPVRKGMLYLGTDNMVYWTRDDGAHWMPLRQNLPPAPVYWLTVQEHFHDLVVATYGRGIYILDDITPLRVLDEEIVDSNVFLFAPRPAYRFQPIYSIKTGGFGSPAGGSHVTGKNPPYGADIHFYLKQAPQSPFDVEILGPDGETIRSLKQTEAKAGVNRVGWDLRYEPPRKAKLRTPPPDKPWVPLGPEGWRPLVTWDLDLLRGQIGPLVPPGTYTVKITVDGQERTQPLRVEKDPHSSGTEADIRAQVAFTLELRDELNDIVDMIDRIEWLRTELEDLETRLDSHPEAKAVLSAASELTRSALAIEARLFDVNLTGAREDAFRAPMMLYGRLSALASDINGWGADFSPTEQQIQVHAVLEERLNQAKEDLEVLTESQLAAFNELLREKGLDGVIVREK